MKNIRQSTINIRRDAWVEVNLANLENNVEELKKVAGKRKMLAVVKADAYGHGAAMIAPTIIASGIDMLGVASIDEGLDLRQENINCDILVLGAVPIWAFNTVAENNISISIFSQEHLKACEQTYERTSIPVKAHIKLDTGMNRIGVCKQDAIDFIKQVQSLECIDLQGIFTHLACAEDENETKKQFEIWESIINSVNTDNLMLHILNTAGMIAYSDYNPCTMVRAGIGLYGLYPDFPEKEFKMPNLKQILSLKARITRIHIMQKGEGISYGYTFKADKNRKIATIPLGYADGVARSLSNKIYGEINGKKVKQIGNITMDQMMFDITDVEANEGDIITVLSDNLTIDSWAKILNTIHYELTCRLKVRLPRIYTR